MSPRLYLTWLLRDSRGARGRLVFFVLCLAVGVAAERIRKSITDDDQKRLADRYVQQLKDAAGGQS